MNIISQYNSAVCKGNFMVYMILEALLGKISIVSCYESKCMLQRTRHKKDCVRELENENYQACIILPSFIQACKPCVGMI